MVVELGFSGELDPEFSIKASSEDDGAILIDESPDTLLLDSEELLIGSETLLSKLLELLSGVLELFSTSLEEGGFGVDEVLELLL